MIFTESDIDFDKITATEFEEVCFDLLTRLGFQSLQWRQGGSDRGRDIEGEYRVNNPLIDYHIEKWFFECKKYSHGVPVGNMSTKFEWATSNQVNHLVFFMVPYPTDSCRVWLDEMKRQVRYKVHIIEEKQLKTLLLKYPDIIEQRFLGRLEKLFRNALIDWEAYDLYPGSQRFIAFCMGLDPKKMNQKELIFLLITYLEKNREYRRQSFPIPNERIELSPILEEICNNALPLSESLISDIELISLETFGVTEIEVNLCRRSVNNVGLVYRKDTQSYQGRIVHVSVEKNRILQILIGRVDDAEEIEVESRIIPDLSDITKIVSEENTSLLNNWWDNSSDDPANNV